MERTLSDQEVRPRGRKVGASTIPRMTSSTAATIDIDASNAASWACDHDVHLGMALLRTWTSTLTAVDIRDTVFTDNPDEPQSSTSTPGTCDCP